MPFIALCPHCRIAKVSAPSRKQGTLHTCPKCQAEFPLEPLSETDLPVDYKLAPPEFDIDQAYRDAERENFASAPTVLASALTGSAVLPLTEKPKPAALPTDVNVDYTPHASMTSDMPFTFVLIALGVFGVGMVATQFPYGRFVSLPFLLGGFVLGFMALPGLSGREKFGWAAVAANALGLFFVLLLPSWLGLNTWVPPGNPDAAPKPMLAIRKSDNSREPAADRIDALHFVWEQGDINIEVTSAAIGPETKDANPLAPPTVAAPAAKAVLRLVVKIKNVGVARALQFTGWPNTPQTAPSVQDSAGQAVPYMRTESPPPPPIYPGKDAEIVLLFEPPSAGIDDLRLDLPAIAFEGKDAVKFRLPAAMIAGLVKPKKP